jgi:hypothetical protein
MVISGRYYRFLVINIVTNITSDLSTFSAGNDGNGSNDILRISMVLTLVFESLAPLLSITMPISLRFVLTSLIRLLYLSFVIC